MYDLHHKTADFGGVMKPADFHITKRDMNSWFRQIGMKTADFVTVWWQQLISIQGGETAFLINISNVRTEGNALYLENVGKSVDKPLVSSRQQFTTESVGLVPTSGRPLRSSDPLNGYWRCRGRFASVPTTYCTVKTYGTCHARTHTGNRWCQFCHLTLHIGLFDHARSRIVHRERSKRSVFTDWLVSYRKLTYLGKAKTSSFVCDRWRYVWTDFQEILYTGF